MNNYDEKYGVEEAFVTEPEGFVKVIRYLAGQTFTANDPRLRLNEMVTEVHYALESDQSVPEGLPTDGVYVKTTSGSEYYASYCIITFTVRSSRSLCRLVWNILLIRVLYITLHCYFNYRTLCF